jgi:hypothetical protein
MRVWYNSNRGIPLNKKADEGLVKKAVELNREKYYDFVSILV